MEYKILCPCHFGMEAVLKRELLNLGYKPIEVENGRVSFIGDELAICRANIFLRSAERVMIVAKSFPATTFEELFVGIKSIPWEEYFPRNARFWVTKASSIDSKLFSPSDIQSIAKKAMVERMKSKYKIEWFPEDGSDYPVRIFMWKDIANVMIDTSGLSLHKRGYRKRTSLAPVSETLAAALLMLTPWKDDRILYDPFCGSGTFLIEAAMMAAKIAPGRSRDFTCRKWELPGKEHWKKAYEEADDIVDLNINTNIYGSDIDPAMIETAEANAKDAGVAHLISLNCCDIASAGDFIPKGEYGFIVTNPPYGERISDDDMAGLYSTIGSVYASLPTWSMYMLTGYPDAVKNIGKKEDKNRKIYNGMLKTYYYQYYGPKPNRKTSPDGKKTSNNM